MSCDIFFDGELWGDGDGGAKVLTTGLVAGQTIEVGWDSLMRIPLTVAGLAPTSVELDIQYLERREDSATWRSIPGFPRSFAGESQVIEVLLLPRYSYKFFAKRTDGDGTTTLLATGELSAAMGVPGLDVINAAVANDEAYDSVSDSLRTSELAGPETVGTGVTLVEETNLADDTYYYYWEHNQSSTFALDLILDGGSGTITATLESSWQDDGTAIASRSYTDTTMSTFGVASMTASGQLIDYLGKLRDCKSHRVKLVAATGAADDADATIYQMKSY